MLFQKGHNRKLILNTYIVIAKNIISVIPILIVP